MAVGKPYNKGLRKANLTGSYGTYHPVVTKSDGVRFPTDVLFIEPDVPDWVYCKTPECDDNPFHPTQKPVELGQYIIRTYTKPGDIVLDNASGSGAFLIAALRERSRFIGIESNKSSFYLRKQPVNFIIRSREWIARETAQLAENQ